MLHNRVPIYVNIAHTTEIHTYTTVDDVVVYPGKEWQHVDKSVNIFPTGKELDVGFLVDITSRHPPSHHRVLATGSIDIRL